MLCCVGSEFAFAEGCVVAVRSHGVCQVRFHCQCIVVVTVIAHRLCSACALQSMLARCTICGGGWVLKSATFFDTFFVYAFLIKISSFGDLALRWSALPRAWNI